MPQLNRLRSTVTVLTAIRRGWALTSPDRNFIIKSKSVNSETMVVHDPAGNYLGAFEINDSGFQQMMDTTINSLTGAAEGE